MPEWTSEAGSATELSAALNQIAILSESVADLSNLYREDIGWQRIGDDVGSFDETGRKTIASRARLMSIANPLIKRGLGLRVAYVHGQGVTVAISDDGSTGQDVNAVYQSFRDDPMVQETFSGSQARETLEKQLGTSGEFFLAYPTNALTGEVQVRHIDPDEISQIISDPEDAASIRYYKRTWSAQKVAADGTVSPEPRVDFYPALGYAPAARPIRINGRDVRWDAPVLHVKVNTVKETGGRGLGDVFASLPWAKMNKEFLERFGTYMKAMTSILYAVSTKAGKAQQAASRAAQMNADAGSTVVTDPNTALSVVSKSGAQIDSDSHRPFAVMVAAGLGVPITMLLGDPGTTGARATAETLDQPMKLEIGLRQQLWTAVERKTADYVIDQAVLAPAGPLRGAAVRKGDRLVVSLPEGDDRGVEISWPEFDDLPVETLVKAIVAADQTEKLPPLVVFKLLAKALEIPDADELIESLTDDDGNWIPLDVADQQVRSNLAARGEDGTGPSGDPEQ